MLASVKATPALNPMSTVSDTKFTSEPARMSHAMNASAATIKAVHAASPPKRLASPPAIVPSVVPMSSEIADVTVMAVCFELHSARRRGR